MVLRTDAAGVGYDSLTGTSRGQEAVLRSFLPPLAVAVVRLKPRACAALRGTFPPPLSVLPRAAHFASPRSSRLAPRLASPRQPSVRMASAPASPVAPASPAPAPAASASAPAAAPTTLASAPTATVAERARTKYSTGGIRFIKHELLGTHPLNRSGLGVSGFHVHEVVASIRTDGLSRRRYRDASVVKVPKKHLAAFLDFNKAMCQGDDLLPPFSSEMRYALLTKNHFGHAIKLYASGTHNLYGTKEPIKPNPGDAQLSQHLEEGIACEVFTEDLWDQDPEGMAAIIGEDNFDAATDLAASEIEVLQALRRLINAHKAEPDSSARFRAVLSAAKQRFGGSAYADADFVNLFNFAIRVPTPLLENLCQVHFAVVPAALLRVRPTDFGAVAKIGTTHPYIKVAIIISLYLGAIASGGGALRRQPGGLAAFAPSVKKEALGKVLVQNLCPTLAGGPSRAPSLLRQCRRHH